jgi:hypothetical protein
MTCRFLALPLALLLLAVAAPATAQQAPSRSATPAVSGVGSLSFALGIPTRDFADNVDGLGYGGSLFAGAQFRAAPFVVGVDFTFLVYDRDTDRVPFSQTVGPRVPVDVVTTNNIVQPHLVLRLQPTGGRVRPYVEALGGFKYLFTETRIEDVEVRDNPDIASSVNFDDVSPSGGGGAGLDIRVYDAPPAAAAESGLRSLSIHVSTQYLFGQEAEYLEEGALRDDNRNGRLDRDELNIRRSRTDLVVPRLGVSVQF